MCICLVLVKIGGVFLWTHMYFKKDWLPCSDFVSPHKFLSQRKWLFLGFQPGMFIITRIYFLLWYILHVYSISVEILYHWWSNGFYNSDVSKRQNTTYLSQTFYLQFQHNKDFFFIVRGQCLKNTIESWSSAINR